MAEETNTTYEPTDSGLTGEALPQVELDRLWMLATAMAAAAGNGIVLMDAEGTFLRYNALARTLLTDAKRGGRPPRSLEVLLPDSVGAVLEKIALMTPFADPLDLALMTPKGRQLRGRLMQLAPGTVVLLLPKPTQESAGDMVAQAQIRALANQTPYFTVLFRQDGRCMGALAQRQGEDMPPLENWFGELAESIFASTSVSRLRQGLIQAGDTGEMVEVPVTLAGGAMGQGVYTCRIVSTAPGEAACIFLSKHEDREAASNLRQQVMLHGKALRSARLGWAEYDHGTGMVHLSDEVCRLLSIVGTQRYFAPRELVKFLPFEELEQLKRHALRLVEKGLPFVQLLTQTQGDTVMRCLQMSAQPAYDTSQKLRGAFVTLQDVSERRAQESSLRQREGQLRTELQHLQKASVLAGIGSWDYSLTYDRIVWSQEALRVLALDNSQMPERIEDLIGVVEGQYQDLLRERLGRALRGEGPVSVEVEVLLGEDLSVPIRIGCSPILMNGMVEGLTGYVQRVTMGGTDVSARIQEQGLLSLLDQLSIPLMWLDSAGNISLVNQAAARILGAVSEEIAGEPIGQLVPELHDFQWLRSREAGRRTMTFRSPVNEADYYVHLEPIRGVTGMPGWSLRFQLKRPDFQGDVAEGLLGAGIGSLVQQLPVAIFELDSDGCVRLMTGQLMQVLQTGAQVIGQRMEEMVEDPTLVEPIRQLLDGKVEDTHWLFPFRGEWIEARAQVRRDAQGQISGVIGVAQLVTARVEVERNLIESRERFRGLVAHSYDLILVLDAEGVITYVSPVTWHFLGCGENELLGRPLLDFVHPDDRTWVRLRFTQLGGNTNGVDTVEYRLRHSAGHYLAVETIATNQLGNPSIQGLVLNNRDITDRKRYEDALRKQETILAEAQQLSKIGNYEILPETGSVYWSEEMYRVFRYPFGRAPLTGEQFFLLIHPEDIDNLRKAIRLVYRGQASEEGVAEFRLAQPDGDGQTVWLQGRMRVAGRTESGATRLVGTVQDITAQKQVEQALRESQEMMRVIYEDGADALFIVNQQTRLIVDCNQRAVLMFEADSKAELKGKWGVALHAEPMSPAEISAAEEIVNEGGVFQMEVHYRTFKGNYFWGALAVKNIHFGKEQLQIVRVNDITAQREIVNARVETERLFQAIFNGSADALFLVDDRTMVLEDFNTRAMEMFDVRGNRDAALLRRIVLRPLVERLAESNNLRGQLETILDEEEEFSTISGEVFWGSLAVKRITVVTRSFLLVRITDITERRRAQSALAEAEERYRSIYQNSVEGIFRSSLEGQVLMLNPTMARLHGYDTAEAFLADISNLAAQVYADPTARTLLIDTLMKEGRVQGYEFEIIRKDKERIWVSENARLVRDIDGTPLFIEGTVQDITARKRAEAALRNAEELYRTIFENAVEGMFQTSAEGMILNINQTFVEILGYDSPEQLMQVTEGKIIKLYPDPEIRSRVVTDLLQDNKVHSYEYLLTRYNDGKAVWVEQQIRAVPDPVTGNVVFFEGSIVDITQRKLAEISLAESESRFRSLAENSPDFIIIANAETWEVTYCNRAELCGHEVGVNMQGDVFLGHTHPDDLVVMLDRRRDLLRKPHGAHMEMELRYRNATGKWEWLHSRETPLRIGPDGRVKELLANVTVITERKQKDEALRRSESLYRTLVQHFPGGSVFLFDLNKRFLVAGGQLLEELGLDRRDMEGRPVERVLTPELYRPLARYFDIALLREPAVNELALNGRFYRVHTVPVKNAEGVVFAGVLMLQDVTDLRKALNALAESEVRFRAIFESAPIGIGIWSRDGALKQVNSALCQLLGYTEDDLLMMNIREISYLEDVSLEERSLQQLMNGEIDSYQLEKRCVRKDGGLIWVKVTVTHLTDQPTGLIRGLALLEDITERVAAEQALRSSEERFRALLQNSSDIIMTFDEKGICRYVTPAVQRILQYEPVELVGSDLLSLIHPAELPTFEQAMTRALLNPVETIAVEFRMRKKDGNWAYFEAQGTNLLSNEGVGAIVANLRDIADRKSAEDRLRASVREKEVLLQEIYHRVKNNLQVVSSLLEFQSDSTEDERVVALLRESQARIYSIALVHEKLYQSRDLHNIEFDEYVSNLLAYISQTFGNDQPVAFQVDVQPVLMDLDKAMRLGLIINELISNALKYAFPNSQPGTIRVEAESVDGQLVTLRISDNGIGLPADFRIEQATSLGLRLVTMITRQLQAKLVVRTGEKGSQFELHFGRIDAPQPRVELPSES